ncbi:hypothetical protein UCDDS831_g05381 [Diplodia seriata]|uniref:Uncharacterized protein n=1 Tax=Diplodia seriata TaxID=420778 RepID=A0A0G2E8W0_9PEZI|nr:hypothetical protein UCDDS831_g05381 [Diplodia seriata]
MAYVPPALRRKLQAAADNGSSEGCNEPASAAGNGAQPEQLPRADDVHDFYWPPVQLEAGEGMRPTVHSTLNSSSSEPNRLKYVMLFQEANPRWEADRLVYVKTNLHYLPGSEKFASQKQPVASGAVKKLDGRTDGHSSEEPLVPAPTSSSNEPSGSTHTPNLTDYQLEPIAVFEQVGNRSGGFRFIGYHKIARLQFLEPKSGDLMRMLEQKFSVTNKFGRVSQQHRSPASWKASLEHRWVVMQLEKDEEAEKSLSPPDVKMNDERNREPRTKNHGPRKSVNELLKEMRLGKSQAEAVADDSEQPA